MPKREDVWVALQSRGTANYPRGTWEATERTRVVHVQAVNGAQLRLVQIGPQIFFGPTGAYFGHPILEPGLRLELEAEALEGAFILCIETADPITDDGPLP